MSTSDSKEFTSNNRRDFIKKGALATTAVIAGVKATPVKAANTKYSVVPSSVLGAADRLRVGFVGVGGQGFGAHVRTVSNINDDGSSRHALPMNVAGVAACDLYSGRRDRAKATLESARSAYNLGEYTIDTYEDHRRLVERDDIDVVCIGTVDHWHAQISIDAMESWPIRRRSSWTARASSAR